MQNVQHCVVLSALFDEFLNVEQDSSDVEFFFLFLLPLKSTFGLVDVFLPDHSSFFSLVPVPATDGFDGFNRSELAVGDVDVMGNSHERLVDVGNGVNDLPCLLVGLLDHIVEALDFRVIEDDGHNLESDQGRHIVNGVVVLVHADVGEEVDEL